MMEITNLMNSLQDTLGQHLPKIAGALAILDNWGQSKNININITLTPIINLHLK